MNNVLSMRHENPFAQPDVLFCCTLLSSDASEALMNALYDHPDVVSVSMDVATGTIDVTPLNAPTTWHIYTTQGDTHYWEKVCDDLRVMLSTDMHIVRVEAVEERDWVRETQQHIQPLHVGSFSILGSHHTDAEAPHSAHIIRLDAGAAFGTGEHATTASCLRAIDTVNRYHTIRHALDMGCGTGILAMAQANIAPACRVLAVDNDPVAVRVTAENIRRNHLHTRIHSYVSQGFAHPVVRHHAPYDLIIANILARPVRAMAGDIATHLAPDGYAILSGFYDRSLRFVMARYAAHGFHVHHIIREGAWIALIIAR
jgi:ribosomal protein L11 methyltransferase